jgi:hypothetical protein
MIEAVKEGANGTYFCRWCFARLQAEENVVGVVGKTVHDVFRCPACNRLHWAPRQDSSKRLAS